MLKFISQYKAPLLFLIALFFIPHTLVLAQDQHAVMTPMLIAKISVKDDKPISRAETQPQFEVVATSADGNQIFIKAQQVQSSKEGKYFAVASSLYEVDIPKRQATKIADLGSIGGMDWLPVTKASVLENSPPKSAQNHAIPLRPFATMENPLSVAPLNDAFSSTSSPEEGVLVYTERLVAPQPEPHWQNFLVIRNIGHPKKDTKPVSTYPVQSKVGIFSPQFSPDGQSILINVGDSGDRYSRFYIYLWNRGTGKFVQGPKEALSYLHSVWSKDSRYIAYVVGGDIEGQPASERDTVQIHIYDTVVGQSHLVASIQGSVDFNWTNQGTLLYSTISTDGNSGLHPSIYEVSASGGATKRIIETGWSPRSSPDGKWLAFSGWSQDSVKKAASPILNERDSPTKGQPVIYLLNRITGAQKIIAENIKNPDMYWSPDSSRLFLVNTEYDRLSGEGELSITDVPLALALSAR